jgi:hypothetical protein
LGQAKADIKRLRAELSVQRKKVRAGARLLKRLASEHQLQLDVDPITWEPLGASLVEAPDAEAPAAPSASGVAPAAVASLPKPVGGTGESSGAARPRPPSLHT